MRESDFPQDCVLCGATIDNVMQSHNPAPLADTGCCCDLCNYTRVVPERVYSILERQSRYEKAPE